VPIGYTRIRFEFLVDPDSDHTERLDPAIGYEYLRKYYDLTAEDVELYRSVIYPFAGAVANRWRAGRVFLAGDAAHLMTPFLGQGACSGLRDSINLAWKLDLVLRGVAGEELLDSYEQERRPHVSAVVAGSDALGAMACEPDVEAARARDEFFLSGNVPEIPGDPVLTAGVVDVADGSMPSPPIGDMAPQGIVARQGRTGRFDDVLGWGFQLVLADADPRPLLSSAQRLFLDEIGCVATGVGEHESEGVVADVDGAYRRFFDEHGIVGFLMRPDFSVFGVLLEAAQIPVLVEVLRGRLTAPAWIGTRKGASA
jgi:3-(3-hydroxy-phenyl)propionate hydroxylase